MRSRALFLEEALVVDCCSHRRIPRRTPLQGGSANVLAGIIHGVCQTFGSSTVTSYCRFRSRAPEPFDHVQRSVCMKPWTSVLSLKPWRQSPACPLPSARPSTHPCRIGIDGMRPAVERHEPNGLRILVDDHHHLRRLDDLKRIGRDVGLRDAQRLAFVAVVSVVRPRTSFGPPERSGTSRRLASEVAA